VWCVDKAAVGREADIPNQTPCISIDSYGRLYV
jgi:hypothetical protein